MNMTPARRFGDTHVYTMAGDGAVAELHVAVEPKLPPAQQGPVAYTTWHSTYVHRVQAWADRLSTMRVPNSGPVDRFWFKSLYFREPNGILFELATDAPGFATDEPMDRWAPHFHCRPSSNRGAPDRGGTKAALERSEFDGIGMDSKSVDI